MVEMKFSDFTNAIVEKIIGFLPESFANATVELSSVIKNNDCRLTGLTIRSVDQNISPTLYLDGFYEQYVNGEYDDLDDVVAKIAELRMSHDVSDNFDTSEITEFDKVREMIVPKIVNTAWNEALLNDRAHTDLPECGLSVTYQILLKQDFSGNASVGITNQILKMWDIRLEDLHELAISNMKRLTPSEFLPMSEVLKSMLDEEAAALFEKEAPEEEMMWVLSNSSRINGAAAILDKDVMKKIGQTFGESRWILIPSSIHEWLAVKLAGDMDNISAIRQMIVEVNEGQVSPEDQLGEIPYIYDAEAGILMAA